MIHSLSNKLFVSFLNVFYVKNWLRKGGKCFTGIYHVNKYKEFEVEMDVVFTQR